MPTGTIRSASAIRRFRDLRAVLSVKSGVMMTAALILMGVAVSHAGAGATSASPELSGSVGGYRWKMEVFKRTKSRDRPCLQVSLDSPRGVGRSTVCGSFDPLPLMVGSTSDSGKAKRAAIGMVFGPHVVRAKVWLRGRSPRNVRLRLLGGSQARKLGLTPLRYAATAYAGPSCLLRVAGYDSSGQVVQPVANIPCG
jgi:hypothetical protein